LTGYDNCIESNVMELHVFDFDGCLFKSPERPDWWPRRAWWTDPESLLPPCVPEEPDESWWSDEVVAAARVSIEDEQIYTVMMTARLKDEFYERIADLLEQQDLQFDELRFKHSPREKSDRYKAKQIGSIVKHNPEIKIVHLWDDQVDNLDAVVELLEDIKIVTHLVESTTHECWRTAHTQIRNAMGPISFSRLSKVKDPSELLDDYDPEDLIAQYKYDGWKMMASHDADQVRLYSRRGKEVQENFPELASALAATLPVDSAVLGEIVAFDPDGVQQISLIQSIAGSGTARALEKTDELYDSGGHLTYFVYDLLEYQGENTAALPFKERDELLRDVVTPSELIQIPDNIPFAEWPEALEDALAIGSEGLVFKPVDEPYIYGKLGDLEKVGHYIKYKPGMKAHVDEVFINSYRMGKAKAIFPAYQWRGDEAVEVGKLSGLPHEIETDVMNRIDEGETIVVEVTFQERLPSGKLRHMGWSRLRPDKPLDSVTMDGETDYRQAAVRTADFPQHPDTVMIPETEFSGRDLTEEDVWRYYDEVKKRIVEQTRGRFTTLMVKVDGTIVQRNRKNEPIEIDTVEDFDQINSGRVIEFHPEISYEDQRGNWITDVLFCDLDPKDEFPWEETKQLAKDVRTRLLEEPDIEDVTIKYSGGRGFHILGHLVDPVPVDEARQRMKELLTQFETDKIQLGIVRQDDMLRLVASPISVQELPRFERQDARIENVLKRRTGSAGSSAMYRIKNDELGIDESWDDEYDAIDQATVLAEEYPGVPFTVLLDARVITTILYDGLVGEFVFQ